MWDSYMEYYLYVREYIEKTQKRHFSVIFGEI